ncbi:GIY-YIG nuclease family protein [Candidatus Woesearchaeota archaeon]|nr:GIY-YIG nuclease family protein [Candidatus Woesearchaeota archaeon]
MSNIVYVLTNPSIPDIVKIGMTSDLTTRMRSLYNSSVPVPFECYFACTVNDMSFVEKQLHDGFDDFRVNPRREFFRIDPERVVSILKMVMIEDVTPKGDIVEDEIDQRSLDKEKKVRGRFNFDMINVPVGSILTFVKDPTITSTVVDKHKIKFEDEVHSLSSSTLKIVHRMGYTWKQVSGPTYWMYEGETLTERRSRMEQE